MKKVFIGLMFLMLAGGVFAMENPIRIQAEPGNEVRLNIRDSTTGITIGNYKDVGIADENGLFETRIYSLSPQDGVVYHVRTFSGLTLLREKKFEASEVSEPLLLDCSGAECSSSTYEYVVDETMVEVEEDVESDVETIEEGVAGVEDGSIDENAVGGEKVVENNSADTSFTGMAIFMDEDGSIRWIYSVGGVVALLFLIVLVLFIARRSGKSKEVVLDDEEKELKLMEGKVKETAEKIQKVKEKKNRREKIYTAKVKLAEEERELRELEEGGNSSKIVKQEEVVEKQGRVAGNAENRVVGAGQQGRVAGNAEGRVEDKVGGVTGQI